LTYEVYFEFINVFQGNFGLKRSPSSRNSSIAGSSEDLLSDTTSVASDVSDSSFNTSLPGRSSIPTRNKVKRTCRCCMLLYFSRIVDNSHTSLYIYQGSVRSVMLNKAAFIWSKIQR